MAEDIKLDRLDFILKPILTKLLALEIHTIRQLYARLGDQTNELEDYLELSDREFANLRTQVQELIKERFPEDDLPRIYPTVNKRGVAVHRLHDSSRPKY